MSSPAIQWYPGHIAKAEKALLEQLKRIDVVLEVRDARIPLATRHPKIDQWIGAKERLLVLNRVDMIPASVRDDWDTWFRQQGTPVLFTNAQQGKGVAGLAKAAQAKGKTMNQRRHQRGLRPRPVRAVVLGFPNVGKSALINRLLKRKVVASARRPGVTRQLRWVRISDELELLDAPGVLPAQLTDQQAALKLAICDDIGEAAYDDELVAATFVEFLKQDHAQLPSRTADQPSALEALATRYGIHPTAYSGEAYLMQMSQARYQGDRQRAARQLLTDYRKGVLGTLALEYPPMVPPSTEAGSA
ncbi:Ribosome biogenesis GTPase A [Halomicronema hongdechloris C2206]|uniref:Ribosome biogenesis GTPase A n=1 Tax=Halomicronema hongdechloris C2206 TaxID=1641165 RepID=A0A1Z3HHC1_9CYAN|nr:ribosome biogenesis GTPase YlqF [Halomicronema hongdechloris]ASC69670.1 Ribosome biogenesis GTPase A [Halomicronema hongdechloris C2206]